MKNMHRLTIFCLLASCPLAGQQPLSGHVQELLGYFEPAPAGTDTLHIEVDLETDSLLPGDTIPNRLFFGTIPAVFLQEIDYVADSSAALVLGRQHFSLNDSTEAYWVEIRQYWFQHHSLFMYDKRRKTFVGRATLAEWFGGDGGQVLIGSWVFDYDGDGQKDIFRREIQHSIQPNGDTVKERNRESASLLRWKNGLFSETPERSKKGKTRRFPIRSFW